jgi:hypothetical protein
MTAAVTRHDHRRLRLAFRKTASVTFDDCIAVFNGATSGRTSPCINDAAASSALHALSIALARENLDRHSYEWSGAPTVALAHPDLESAWLSGKDIFANVRRDMRPADFERIVSASTMEFGHP